MRAILILLIQLLSRVVKLWETGGARAVLAENLLSNHANAGQGHCFRPSFCHDPLFQFFHWQDNFRVLGMEPFPTVPGIPVSHPFVRRPIRNIRQECLDQLLYWNAADLEQSPLISV